MIVRVTSLGEERVRPQSFAFLLFFAAACASDPKEVRPHLEGMSGPHLATGALAYVFNVPPARVHDAMEAVLRDRFQISQVRRRQKSDLAAATSI